MSQKSFFLIAFRKWSMRLVDLALSWEKSCPELSTWKPPFFVLFWQRSGQCARPTELRSGTPEAGYFCGRTLGENMRTSFLAEYQTPKVSTPVSTRAMGSPSSKVGNPVKCASSTDAKTSLSATAVQEVFVATFCDARAMPAACKHYESTSRFHEFKTSRSR